MVVRVASSIRGFLFSFRHSPTFGGLRSRHGCWTTLSFFAIIFTQEWLSRRLVLLLLYSMWVVFWMSSGRNSGSRYLGNSLPSGFILDGQMVGLDWIDLIGWP